MLLKSIKTITRNKLCLVSSRFAEIITFYMLNSRLGALKAIESKTLRSLLLSQRVLVHRTASFRVWLLFKLPRVLRRCVSGPLSQQHALSSSRTENLDSVDMHQQLWHHNLTCRTTRCSLISASFCPFVRVVVFLQSLVIATTLAHKMFCTDFVYYAACTSCRAVVIEIIAHL